VPIHDGVVGIEVGGSLASLLLLVFPFVQVLLALMTLLAWFPIVLVVISH
jgi:hypothetical protein